MPAPSPKGACGICLSEHDEAVEKERKKCRTSAGIGETVQLWQGGKIWSKFT